MAEYIERETCLEKVCEACNMQFGDDAPCEPSDCFMREKLMAIPTAEVEPERHGHWIYEAHEEKVNCRWNVTAECSECCDEKNEIWAGFFPGVPGCIAKDVALDSAKTVKLSNFCPNCGARMDLGGAENA